MKIAQTLRKPANWQDFESLCLLLWREEWKSEDLKKNGRNGQAQKGVDICGHRNGEDRYSGIQCKCKPGNKPLTTGEIDEEIENAKAFKPALRRLVFATTADKDVDIEEYVRIKDDENRMSGLFSIDIKSWQDIIDLLELNKAVLNTYLDIVAEDYAVSITFDNGSEETTIHPQFSRIHYMEPVPKVERQKPVDPQVAAISVATGGWLSQIQQIKTEAYAYRDPVMARARMVRGTVKTNHAFCPLKFMVVNQGRTPIDDYKITFRFENDHVFFTRDNVEKKMMFPDINFGGIPNINLEDGVGITMYGNSVIPGDCATSDDFYVHVPTDVEEVNIFWQLLSRHYAAEGKLKLKVEMVYREDFKYEKERAGDIEEGDYIEVEEITD